MIRRFNLLSTFLLGASSILVQAKETKRPNIIFILVDDYRYDAMGYCGNEIVKTPAIDSLARNGTFFRNAFSSTPISSASRASILTGLYERTHRYSFVSGPLDDNFVKDSYPCKLKEAGYHTALYGKLGVKCTRISELFDEIEDYDRSGKIKENGYFYKTLNNDTVHLTRYTGQKGLDFIERQNQDKPFFLSLCFSAPHAHDSSKQQYFWDKGQEGMYDNVTVPKPLMSEDKYFDRLPDAVKSGFSRIRWSWRFDTPKKYQSMMKGYYRMISGVDQEISDICKMLLKKGLADNTVIVFMGDNGYFLGERQLADKWMMYDLSVRIPLIIYDPRIKRHIEVNEQVLNVDMASTFSDFADAEISQKWQGRSLKGFLTDKSYALNRDTILLEHLWETNDIPSSEGIRTKEWKYFRYVNDGRQEEMYKIKDDPAEEFNLAKNPEYKEILYELRRKTDELARRYSYNGWIAPQNLSVTYLDNEKYSMANGGKMMFGWTIPYYSQAQCAYQIIVSESEENINNNVGDMWNSGYVWGYNSYNIVYSGKRLNKGVTYYWRVRFWDYLNRTSQYSDVQNFVYGEDKRHNTENKGTYTIQDQLLWGISTVVDDGIIVIINPNMGNVRRSNMVFDTLAGDIIAEYRLVGGKRNYVITVPANICVDFSIPKDIKGMLVLNGEYQPLLFGKLRLKAGRNTIQIRK